MVLKRRDLNPYYRRETTNCVRTMDCHPESPSPTKRNRQNDFDLLSATEHHQKIRSLGPRLAPTWHPFGTAFDLIAIASKLPSGSRPDIYFGRGPAVPSRRENVKLKTIEGRRRLHQSFATKDSTQMARCSLNSIANLSNRF